MVEFNNLSEFFVSYYESYGRNYPWRKPGLTRYHILVSEILLKRTSGDAVADFWEYFFHQYPDIYALDNATQEELAEILYPLGLQNSRSRQLKQLSGIIISEFEGQVPNDPRGLPGVGQYVSGALKMMFDDFSHLPQDVNIHRVLGD